ncbi:MAG: trans-aconitate 2-methyltransferase [Burkholderiaceae bacterium]
MTWSARQYSRFERERTRPVHDLVGALTIAEVRSAVDLGCGPGNSTEVLAQRFPGAAIVGLDSAPDMIDAARRRARGLRFDLADIAAWQPDEPVDVILANASLQWLPDHATLYPRLARALRPGGQLAIQTPDNLDEPAHRLAREIAADGPWAAKIGKIAHRPRHAPPFYYALLASVCADVDVWRTTYFHPLADHAAIVEWFKGTGLQPFLEPLDEAERAAYLARYLAAVTDAYPTLPDGKVLLPFPRLFIVATLGS